VTSALRDGEHAVGVKPQATRESSGILVRLFWDEVSRSGSVIVVEYRDRNEDVAYTVRQPSDRALDAFYHPNAYRPLATLDRYSVRV
jgi:hypothetical protein